MANGPKCPWPTNAPGQRPVRTAGSWPMAVWQPVVLARLHAARTQARQRGSVASGGSDCAAPGSGGLRRWQIQCGVTTMANASEGNHGAHWL
jgi:hypothetical protein